MSHPLVLPRALKPGDRIAVVATSWGAGTHLPDRFDRGLRALRDLGFEPVVMPHARGGTDGIRTWVSASATQRAEDLHQAFTDPSIAAVLSVIGGEVSAQMLEELDIDLIARHPKVLCGYSDTGTLLHAIHRATGLVTFYGPALVPEFGDPEGPFPETVDHWRRVTGSTEPAGALPRVEWQSGDSRIVADRHGRNMRRGGTERRRALRPGRASGPLLAACLPTMLRLAGTRWWPDTEGRILILEPSEEPYDVSWADADLTQLRTMGVLEGLAGLAIGRTYNWEQGDVERFHAVVLDAVRDYDYPVLAGLEVSHTAPLLTIPIGVMGSVDGIDLSIDEPAVVE